MNKYLIVAAFFVSGHSFGQDFTRTTRDGNDSGSILRAELLKSQVAPPITYSASIVPSSQSATGNIDISSQRGKVIVLYFFTAFCGRCIEASQQIGSIFLNSPQDKIAILGVMGSDYTFEDSTKAAIKYKIPFGVVQDKSNQTFNSYGILGVPMFCIIDPAGKVSKFCYTDKLKFCIASEFIKQKAKAQQGAAANP